MRKGEGAFWSPLVFDDPIWTLARAILRCFGPVSRPTFAPGPHPIGASRIEARDNLPAA
jgi:hypothetical protein